MEKPELSEMPEGWLKYGLPGGQTVEIRNRIFPLIETYCSKNGLDGGNDIDFEAGCKCFLVIAFIPLTQRQRDELKQIVIENSPPDYAFHFLDYSNQIQVIVSKGASLPTLIYLPGLHGDSTLVSKFSSALANRVRFVEMTYPRTQKWSMADYAEAVEKALLERGIARGWLLGESFGSQLVWPFLEWNLEGREKSFQVEGVVLAGGFVKHPWPWGPGALRLIGRMTPMWLYRIELKIYAWYARFRQRNSKGWDTMEAFVARRTWRDRQAMQHRLKLLDGYDPREIARRTKTPIYYLAGSVDPLVPWPLVRWWLRRNCGSYRGGKTFWLADHNVLATSPKRAAEVVLGWMGGGNGVME